LCASMTHLTETSNPAEWIHCWSR